MFYFYLLECWRHWSRQRLIPLRPVCSRDKARQRKARWWCDFMFDRLFNANNKMCPQQTMHSSKMRSLHPEFLAARHSVKRLVLLFPFFLLFLSSFAHRFRCAFRWCFMLCTLQSFQLDSQFICFIVMLCFTWMGIYSTFFSPSISSLSSHSQAQDVLQQYNRNEYFVLFGISTTIQITM